MLTLKRLSVLVFALLLASGPAVSAAGITVASGSSIEAPTTGGAGVELLTGLAAAAAVGMAIRVKDTGLIAKKFVQRAQQAAPEYTEGVKAAGADWEAGAAAGEDNYKQAVTEAAAQGRFGKGIRAAGAGKYVNNAAGKGAQRFGPGVAQAEGEYAKGVAPVLETLRGLTLAPRGVKGSPQNQARANQVASALREMKLKR